MPIIEIAEPFLLRLNNGAEHHMPAGRLEVSDEVAEHWYTKLHLIDAPKTVHPSIAPPAPPFGVVALPPDPDADAKTEEASEKAARDEEEAAATATNAARVNATSPMPRPPGVAAPATPPLRPAAGKVP